MIRRFVERMSRGIILKRRLPAFVGGLSLYVSPDSQLKYLKPGIKAFDLPLLRLARDHVQADSIVWDVGANVGVFAFAAAGIATQGHIVAIEADMWLASLLRRSLRAQKQLACDFTVLCTAISERNGIGEFAIARRGRASNYLTAAGGWTQAGGVRERVHVPTLTIDTLLDCIRPPTFLKIDVEGAEVLVLRGAKRMLQTVRPSIYIEVGRENVSQVSEILRAADYQLFDSTKPIANQEPLEQCVQDTLARPC
jgi:FkbM family methyltransferase